MGAHAPTLRKKATLKIRTPQERTSATISKKLIYRIYKEIYHIKKINLYNLERNQPIQNW